MTLTVTSYAEFLTTDDTDSICHNVAVTMLRACAALATGLERLRERLDDQSAKFTELNTFSGSLRGYRPSTQKDATEAAELGTTSELGTSEDDSKAVIKKLEYYGVVVKSDDYAEQADGKPYKVQQGVYDQWLIGLGTAADTISADIKTLQTKVQSMLEQWSKLVESSGSSFKGGTDTCNKLISYMS